MRSRILAILAALACAGIFLALYLPSLPFPYAFDDVSNVIQNRAIRYLDHPRIFFESEHARNRPLTSLSFALSYRAAGLSLSALRAPNLLFHFLNALLVGLFFLRFFRRQKGAEWGAVLAGGLFLLHPLATDSVVYLSGRSSLMVLFFVLSALWFYGRERPGFFSWLGFLISAVAAMLTKESAVTLLPLLLLYHVQMRRRWVELLPYFLPLLIAGVAGAYLKSAFLAGAIRGYYQIGGEVDIYSIVDFWRLSLAQWPKLLLLFFRFDLQAIDHQIYAPLSWLDWRVLAGILLWGLLPWLLIRLWKTRLAAYFFALWVFASLSVTNSVFPVLDPLAERHLYMALPALAWCVGWGLQYFHERYGKGWLAVFLLLPLAAFATQPRVELWRSPKALWTDAYRLYPRKFRVVYNTWNAHFLEGSNYEEALKMLTDYLQGLNPGTLTFEEQELVIQAAGVTLAREIDQEKSDIWKRGPELLAGLSDFWKDFILLSAGLRLSPGEAWLKYWEGAVERAEGARLSKRAREPNLANNSYYILRAQYFAKRGNRAAAIADYEAVLRQFPGKFFPYWTKREDLGDLYLAEGREKDALLQYELASSQYRSYKRFPTDIYQKLAKIFYDRKDYMRAADALGQLVRVLSDDPELRQRYAAMLRAQRDKTAMQQTKEAEFYSEHAVSPFDTREAVSP